MSTHSRIDADRLALRRAAVFSISRAAELLPVRDGKARRWLRDRRLIRKLAGRSVVVLGGRAGRAGRRQPRTAAPIATAPSNLPAQDQAVAHGGSVSDLCQVGDPCHHPASSRHENRAQHGKHPP